MKAADALGTLSSAVDEVGQHDHLCLLYSSTEEQFAAVVPFIRRGLELGERCVYVAGENSVDAVRAKLTHAGIDTEAHRARGALDVLAGLDLHGSDRGLDADAVIAFLEAAVEAALADGFPALRVTSEMTWPPAAGQGGERPLEFEAKLNDFLLHHPASALCQYRREHFPPETLSAVIGSHPLVIAEQTVCRNPRYAEPVTLLEPDADSHDIDGVLESVVRTERTLRAEERAAAEWRATFDALPDLVCLLDRDGTILRCNRSMARMFGGAPSALSGRACHELMHGSADFMDRCPFRRMLDSGVRETLDIQLGEHWYQVSADPLRDHLGEIAGAVHILRDITAAKHAAVALAEERRWLIEVNALAVELADAGPTTDVGEILARRLRETTGAVGVSFGLYDAEARTIGPMRLDLAPSVRRFVPRPLRRRLEQINTPIDEETRVRAATEVIVPMSSLSEATRGLLPASIAGRLQRAAAVDRFVSLAFVAEGVLYGSSLLALREGAMDPPRDLLEAFARMAAVALRRRRIEDERARAEAEVRRLNADLERRVRERTLDLTAATQELRELVYSVSHDLRTPLRAIDGFSLTVLEDCGDAIGEHGRSDLHRVRAAAQKMGELIDALLSLSQLGRRTVTRENVDLSAIATRVVEELRSAAPDRDVEVTIQKGLLAEADPALTAVVLDNLLGNAWKFTARQKRGHIWFGAQTRAGERVFFVHDDGAGFDATYTDKLFQPFQRLHTADEFPGTGIGLATVARVLGRMGGRWWAEGRPGGGATFFFTLPRD